MHNCVDKSIRISSLRNRWLIESQVAALLIILFNLLQIVYYSFFFCLIFTVTYQNCTFLCVYCSCSYNRCPQGRWQTALMATKLHDPKYIYWSAWMTCSGRSVITTVLKAPRECEWFRFSSHYKKYHHSFQWFGWNNFFHLKHPTLWHFCLYCELNHLLHCL